MKLNPTPAVSDVADGIRQGMGGINGVSDLDVSTRGRTITVTARVEKDAKTRVQSFIEGYGDCGFGIVLDVRTRA